METAESLSMSRWQGESRFCSAIQALRQEEFACASKADLREISRPASDSAGGWFVYLNKENPQTH